jgi:glycosyltransferase involved in cell wall biosynthesis
MSATAVIPAHNEAARIAPVLHAVLSASAVAEVIVVDDGSEDRTAQVASIEGVTVIRLRRNLGKAAAMREGAKRAKHAVVVFLDADLIGLTPQHVADLVHPVLAGEADMTVGQFWSGSPFVTAWMRLCPAISGQRAMRVADLLDVPDLENSGYGVEVVITRSAINRRQRVRYVHLPRISHVVKESKRGLARGLATRTVMYGQILRCMIEDRYHHLRDLVRSRV